MLTRVAETIGYIVIESGSGNVGTEYRAFVGADSILGIDNSPPFNYTFASIGNPVAVVASSAAMDDNDGGWPVLFGSSPFTATSVGLAINEDRFADAERSHSSEQVAVVAIGTPQAAAALLATATASLESLDAGAFQYRSLRARRVRRCNRSGPRF